MELNRTQVAVAIIAYNRPMLLAGLIKRLQPQLAGIDVHLFLDQASMDICPVYGVPFKQTVKLTDMQEEMFKTAFPGGKVHRPELNLGNGFNQKLARDYIFNNYRIGIFFEDDFWPTSDYITNLLEMSLTFEPDPRVGWITYNGDVPYEQHVQEPMANLPHHHEHLWAWLSWSEKYKMISEDMKTYYRILSRNIRYDNRDTEAIRQLFQLWGYQRYTLPTSQDMATVLAMLKSGMYGVATSFNSGINVGLMGIHTPVEDAFKSNARIRYDLLELDQSPAIEWDEDYSETFHHLYNLARQEFPSLVEKGLSSYGHRAAFSWAPYIWMDYFWSDIVYLRKLINELHPQRVLQVGFDYAAIYYPSLFDYLEWDVIEWLRTEWMDEAENAFDCRYTKLGLEQDGLPYHQSDRFRSWLKDNRGCYDLVYVRRVEDRKCDQDRNAMVAPLRSLLSDKGKIVVKEDFQFRVEG